MKLILPKHGAYEYEEKKSKFLAYCAAVKCEEEARSIVERIRAEHPKANHNVFAYAVGSVTRASDDGEPHGTAGLPVLGLFQKSGIIDFVCVVTRYFGGTLLGAGGLVRAYTRAAKGALQAAEPQELVVYHEFTFAVPYANFDKIKYELNKSGIEITHVEFTDICTVSVKVKEQQMAEFKELIHE